MTADIYENRFVAVRQEAWHRVGTVIDDSIAPSEAVAKYELDTGAESVELVAMVGGDFKTTGLVGIGHTYGDTFTVFGTVKKDGFELTQLPEVLPAIDELATKYPLSCAGTLGKGSEIFFTLGAGKSEIAGEEYNDFLVVRHSYKPGVAHLVMWTPMRVVCRNTLIAGESLSTTTLRVAHTRNSQARLSAAMIIADAVKQKASIKARLEEFAKKQIVDAQVDAILTEVYSRYASKNQVGEDVSDLVGTEVMALFNKPAAAQERYVAKLTDTTTQAYGRFNDEFPKLAGTAYGLYQAVVEVADHRRGQNETRMAESSLVGTRAAEKIAAWEILSRLN